MKSFNFVIFVFFVIQVNTQVLFKEEAISHGLFGTFGTGFVGGGISFYDFDSDGWDDITLGTQNGEHILFYKNTGGSFVQVYPNISDDVGENKQRKTRGNDQPQKYHESEHTFQPNRSTNTHPPTCCQ